jgi:hypothetical protein
VFLLSRALAAGCLGQFIHFERRSLVFATLSDAVPILCEAPVLIAIPNGADKTLGVLLLAKNQTGRINLTVDRRRLRPEGESRA